jgi:hypothetical protein
VNRWRKTTRLFIKHPIFNNLLRRQIGRHAHSAQALTRDVKPIQSIFCRVPKGGLSQTIGLGCHAVPLRLDDGHCHISLREGDRHLNFEL